MPEPTTDTPDDDRPAAACEADDERIERLVKAHALKLAEHCDSVRIFVTRNRGDGNWGTYSYGDGNYFAQRDSVREWLMKQDQSTRNEAE